MPTPDRCTRLLLAATLGALVGCTMPPRATTQADPPVAVMPSPASASPSPDAPASPDASASTAPDAQVLVGAGDITSCARSEDEATAALLEGIDGIVFTTGDNVYDAGSDQNYAACYGPSWGAELARTRPAIGNHDVKDDNGAAYFRYFGAAAGTPGEGWYSYDAGTWHVVVLNSNCDLVSCEAGSPQVAWLASDLAAAGADCTLAMWHHPRFSSGPHGDDPAVSPFWDALYAAGAELVLVGHDHLYERFAPQNPSAAPDSARGIRQITVGTGGKELYDIEHAPANSEVLINDRFGVLELTLTDGAYAWRFLATPDAAVLDSGSGTCH